MAFGALKKKNEFKEKKRKESSYLTILIGNEMYAVDVRKVKQVLKIADISFVPNSLPFMKGVIDLRGKIVPLIDMRLKFNIEENKYIDSASIVVVRVKKNLIGMIVDNVVDVVTLKLSLVQDVPHYTANIEADCIKGLSQVDDRIIIIMNVDRILTSDELESVKT